MKNKDAFAKETEQLKLLLKAMEDTRGVKIENMCTEVRISRKNDFFLLQPC